MIGIYCPQKESKKIGSSEISQSNILNYKRRSKLVSYEIQNKKIKTIETLKNCYNLLFDLKNTLSDHIQLAKEEKRKLTLTEQYYCQSLINKTQTEILSTYHIYSKNVNLKSLNKQEKKLIKDINNITQILYIIYDDIKKYSIF